MTALTNDRDTQEIRGRLFGFPVSAGKKCYAGGLAVLHGGTAEPGATAVGLVAVGRFEETVDNTAGAAGAVSVLVRRGCFRFANSVGDDLVTLADVGSPAYIVDDATVAKTSATNTRSTAGVIMCVDSLGVWVKI